jgi:hypothetical protein
MPIRCFCGDDLSNDPYHHLSCSKEKATTVTHRHDLVRHAIEGWIKRVGGSAWAEPEHLHYEDGRRADLLITMAHQQVLTDVVVRHPTAPSTVAKAAQEQLFVAKEAEKRKETRHKPTADRIGAAFSAFAVESYGAFGPQAAALVDRIAAYADTTSKWASVAVRSNLINAVAVAVQKGNAIILASGLQRSRESFHGGHDRRARGRRRAG